MGSHHSDGWWGNARERRLTIRRALKPGRKRGWFGRWIHRRRKRFYG